MGRIEIARELVRMARSVESASRSAADVIPFDVSRDLKRVGLVVTGGEQVGPSVYVAVRNQTIGKAQMRALLAMPAFQLVGASAGRGLELMFDI